MFQTENEQTDTLNPCNLLLLDEVHRYDSSNGKDKRSYIAEKNKRDIDQSQGYIYSAVLGKHTSDILNNVYSNSLLISSSSHQRGSLESRHQPLFPLSTARAPRGGDPVQYTSTCVLYSSTCVLYSSTCVPYSSTCVQYAKPVYAGDPLPMLAP